MCHLVRCPNCLLYAATGCNDPEHRAATMARVEPGRRCHCREEQMARLEERARSAVLPPVPTR